MNDKKDKKVVPGFPSDWQTSLTLQLYPSLVRSLPQSPVNTLSPIPSSLFPLPPLPDGPNYRSYTTINITPTVHLP